MWFLHACMQSRIVVKSSLVHAPNSPNDKSLHFWSFVQLFSLWFLNNLCFFLSSIVVVASMKAVLKKEKKTVTPLDRGFNENINWMTLADAEKESRTRYML